MPREGEESKVESKKKVTSLLKRKRRVCDNSYSVVLILYLPRTLQRPGTMYTTTHFALAEVYGLQAYTFSVYKWWY